MARRTWRTKPSRPWIWTRVRSSAMTSSHHHAGRRRGGHDLSRGDTPGGRFGGGRTDRHADCEWPIQSSRTRDVRSGHGQGLSQRRELGGHARDGRAELRFGSATTTAQLKDKAEQQPAVYANRRRVEGERGKRLLRRRGEFLERPFAHQYETGALRRVHVRGRKNVAKRVLLQAAAFNLALILRSITKAGTPRGLADLKSKLFYALCRLLAAL